MMSISTMASSGVASTSSIASLPVVAVSTFMPRRSSTLESAKMLRASSSTSSTVRPTRSSSELLQPLQHPLLLRRQVGHHAVQEQRGLVEQPLRRLHALDHDAARHGVQLGVLLGGKLAAGEHHDRHVGQRLSPRIRSSTSKPDMSGSRRSSTTQSHGCSRSMFSASAPVSAVTISMSSWPSSSVMLICSARIVLDDQQAFAPRLGDIP